MALRHGYWLCLLGLAAASPAWAEPPVRAGLGAPWYVDGKLHWPPDDGCADTPAAETLPPGTRIDQYGSDASSLFSVPGTTADARALPYDPAKLPYAVYIVRKPLDVQECTVAAWFGQAGGGEQFRAAASAAQLKTEGAIAPQ